MLDPFCQCFSFWSKSDEDLEIPNSVSQIEESDISLDLNRAGNIFYYKIIFLNKFLGQDVVIVKNGKRLCGTGGAISNTPIVQNKAYFEVKIRSDGQWGVGLATKRVDLNTVPLGTDTESWVLRNDGNFFHNNEIKFRTRKSFEEGDIIGIAYDHELLNFYLNGDDLQTSITGIRGTVFPVFYGLYFY